MARWSEVRNRECSKKIFDFTEARKTGDAYVWGKNWRTSKLNELNNFFTVKEEDGDYVLYPINTTGKFTAKDGGYGLLLTGVKLDIQVILYIFLQIQVLKITLFTHFI